MSATTSTTTANDTISITLTNRRPLRIRKGLWGLIARADRHDGQVECQANHEWAIRVRERADGRRVVYGWLRAGHGGVHIGWRGAEGGKLVEAIDGRPDEEGTIRAIRRVGELVEDERLADECIADLPAESLDELPAIPAAADLATLLALLVQAVPHVPSELAEEIRAALAGQVKT